MPVGTGIFTEIRESGNYYVDKTHVIGKIVRDNGKIIGDTGKMDWDYGKMNREIGKASGIECFIFIFLQF